MSSRIRVRGQRSILSTFIHRTSTNDDQASDCRGSVANKKRPKISLSDFLDRKLQKSSKFVQGKEKPFLSPGTSVGANQFINGANADQKTKGPDLNGTLDIVLEQFKHNKENVGFSSEDSIQSSTVTNETKEAQIEDMRKQKNQFEGLHGKPPAPKGLVILGGDPTPKQAKYQKPFIRNDLKEKQLPVYNHYASGSGWWDSDMEGIDNDEVGFNEVWEGVGSATIGGLDWH